MDLTTVFSGDWSLLTPTMLTHYLFVLVMLVFMEGILSADNALVLAVMVRPLPKKEQGHALFYGLVGAIVLRFLALFAISYLADVWEAQAAGAAYLIYISVKNLYRYYTKKPSEKHAAEVNVPPEGTACSRREFWWTVVRVELADIAFAVDSILAAVAIAMALPDTGIGHIGGLDTGKFLVVLLGGFAGIVLMRLAAQVFVHLLDKHPKLEVAAFLLVLWVGVKLVVLTLAHPVIGVLPEKFPESAAWHIVFFGTMIAIGLRGWFTSTRAGKSN